MRLIFVNRFFYPDHSATSQMLSGIAFALARRRHRVCIVTSRLSYDDPNRMLPPLETIDGVDVYRVATSRFGRSGLLGRAADYATFYLTAAWRVLRLARRGDVVVAKTDPPMLSMVLWPVAALRGAHLVNWLQDIFPEVAVALGVGGHRLGRIGFAMAGSLRDLSLRHAQVNVVLGERMADHVAGLGVARERIRVVPNYADGALITPVERAENPLRKAWGLADCFVVGYSGNLGRAHDYETFLDAIERIERWPEPKAGTGSIRWLFIGGGAQLEGLRRAAERRGVTSVLTRPYQPQELLAQSLSLPDVHLVTLRPELEGLIVPSKIYGIAAAGRATVFVGDRDGEIARLVARTRSGVTVDQGDGAALAAVVVALSKDTSEVAAQGARARRSFEAEFDFPIAVEAWERIADEFAGRDSGAAARSTTAA